MPHAKASAKERGNRGVGQTLSRAAAILDILAQEREKGLRFTDLVALSGFSKTTTFRLLAAMQEFGFVELDELTHRYFAGFRHLTWGSAARDRLGIAERAAPALRALAETTGDTVYLHFRDEIVSLCVSRYEGHFPIRAYPLRHGDRSALGIGSGSLAILAFHVSDAEAEVILKDPEHIRLRERRGVTEKQIRALVKTAHKNGYACVSNLAPGMTGVALPIRLDIDRPSASVSVTTTTERLTQPRRQEVLLELQRTVEEVGHIFKEMTALTR